MMLHITEAEWMELRRKAALYDEAQKQEPVRFHCHNSTFSPAYVCSKPGDMSGDYYARPSPPPDVRELVEALREGRRAIGEHSAPHDCYATGPLTGDAVIDLVQCPACCFIAAHDSAIAKWENKP